MGRMAKFTQSSVGRAVMGFVGTASVLLGAPLFSQDADAARPLTNATAHAAGA